MVLKRIISLLLSILLLLSVSACNSSPILSDQTDTGRLLERKNFFPKRDFDSAPTFSELEYKHYTRDRIEPLLDKLYELCEGEHPEDRFETYLTDVLDEFGYADTQQILLELKYDMDTSYVETAEELIYLDETLYELRDEYNMALRALAESENSKLMRTIFTDEEIAGFSEYEDPDQEELEIYLEIEKKKQLYDNLISKNNPDFKKITELFIELIALNKKSAEFSGYESFAEMTYSCDFLRNYRPDDAGELWGYVKKYFAPIISKYEHDYYSACRRLLYVNRPNNTMEPLEAIKTVAEGSSYELGAAYRFLVDKGLYDIGISKNKANFSYTICLYNYNVPFIFHCADGTLSDNFILMHEFGHFVNTAYQDYTYYETMEDIDAAELQAHSMEFLATLYYEEIFENLASEALKYLILDTAMGVTDGAMYDEFLQRAYEEEELTSEKLLDIYKELYLDYGYSPYYGYEYEWCYIPHLFKMPFYYISYCVASLGALQVYGELLKDPHKGTEIVMKLLASDNCEIDFETLMENVGLLSVFSEDGFEDISEALEYSLKNLCRFS